MGTKSQRLMLKRRKAFGRPYRYMPRADLVDRLSHELRLPPEAIVRQIHEERMFLLKQVYNLPIMAGEI